MKRLATRPNLFISFSGGKTSAYMTNRLLTEHRHEWDKIVVGFANTGQEHEKTLEYVNACDKHYGFNVVWLEAVVDPEKGKGTRHRIVSYGKHSTRGEPFEEVIAKYGLPNNQYPHCTRETKLQPIGSYLRSIGWNNGDFNVAIGIRYDELDRISPKTMEDGGIYPLITLKVTKRDVLAWEMAQPVRLGLPEHLGNCTWCWKKSFRKLATLSLEEPEVFDFPRRMEATHKDSGAGLGDRRFFRGRKTVDDIFAMAREPGFQPFVDSFPYDNTEMDMGAACGESCEVGTDGAGDQGLFEFLEEPQLALT